MIEKIHHNNIEYTSQGFEHESQDLWYTTQDIINEQQDYKKDTEHTS